MVCRGWLCPLWWSCQKSLILGSFLDPLLGTNILGSVLLNFFFYPNICLYTSTYFEIFLFYPYLTLVYFIILYFFGKLYTPQNTVSVRYFVFRYVNYRYTFVFNFFNTGTLFTSVPVWVICKYTFVIIPVYFPQV
jgi:hypothetical protein